MRKQAVNDTQKEHRQMFVDNFQPLYDEIGQQDRLEKQQFQQPASFANSNSLFGSNKREAKKQKKQKKQNSN